MTKLLGVIGDPIAHSLSPLIHNGWIRDMGFDATYEAMHVPAGSFDEALKTLEKRDILGVNVTLPHKTDALEAASDATVAARKIGAANTLTYQENGFWTADNTDAPGFIQALGPFNPDTDKVLILGAGGSARALVYALAKAQAKLRVLNRTVSKAEALRSELGNKNTFAGPLSQYIEYIDSATIVINTTSMGHDDRALELPAGRDRLFFDISYGKAAASQLNEAESKGWQTRDGLHMLIAQAALSFEVWFGEAPDQASALRRGRIALEAVA